MLPEDSIEVRYREVTAEQLKQGYVVNSGLMCQRFDFHVLHKTEKGTYIVLEPSITRLESTCGPRHFVQVHES